MMLYQILVLVSLLVFLGILLRNLLDLPRLPDESCGGMPMVSILVPARNEERHIRQCIESLLVQDYANFEVIVLDDNSTDETWAALKELAGRAGAKLTLLRGKPLPDGWHGKAWACQQLAEKAKGVLLLFTDADTRHRTDTLKRSVAALQTSGADLLSVTPAQEMLTFWEKLIVPLVYHILLCYLPIRLVGRSRSPAFCYAIGQFILFRSEAYHRLGGHRSVRTCLVEDVWLCKLVKRSGGTVAVYNGIDAVSCRMYHDLRGIWDGFSKNLFAGLGYSTPGLLMLMALVVLLYLAPWGFVLFAVLNRDFTIPGFWLPAAQILTALTCRLIIAFAFRQPVSITLLHAFSQVVLLAIALNSFRLVKFGNGPVWKERRYRFVNEDRAAG
jgi:chlorobactene glucosyltransferase